MADSDLDFLGDIDEDLSEEDVQILNDEKLIGLIKKDYTYPEVTDPDFQKKLYEKREYYNNKIEDRPELKTYEEKAALREKICRPSSFTLQPYQAFAGNFINPDTPFKGLLLFLGLGVGKTIASITIAETFKPLVSKYGTKIYVLTSGPLIKENFKEELIKATGDTYLKNLNSDVINEADKQRLKKAAIANALQYYRFMSYRSFYKKVLGEKIVDKTRSEANEKAKVTYRKNEEGEFDRDFAIDRLYNLNNSVVIIDEVHNLTGNAYGEALMHIKANSTNLKVVGLSATPIKNLADDVVELLNFVRPSDSPVNRDKIFTSEKNHEMQLKHSGLEYLKKMANGYISYLRGSDPLSFAKRIDIGTIPPGLLFTKVIRCPMLPFQLKTYKETLEHVDDSLDRRSEAVANFAFPGLDAKNNLIGYFGREGINTVLNQMHNSSSIINKKVASEILNNKELENDSNLVRVSDGGKMITGKILKEENLKYFSIKFTEALKNVNDLIAGKKGPRTAFVYSNLVRVGIEIFQEVLNNNGYLEYNENKNTYKIRPNTRCYYCGKDFSDHKDSVDSTHTFHPATYVVVTGTSTEESAEIIPEEKQYILNNVFSSLDNIDGKHIKLVLGSKVMNEGLSLKYVAEVHILDVYFNLGRVDQVIGRAIRHCSHYAMMSKENPYPEVKVYKYCVSMDSGLSSEEELYRKAELKYLLVKKVERAFKEVAIDCPLNRAGNIFDDDLKQYSNCKHPQEARDGDVICPAICDFMPCNYKCESTALNDKYFDEETNKYRQVKKSDIDYGTFTNNLAKNEIEAAKSKIAELYKTKFLYTLKDIVNYVKNSYEGEKKDLFDEFFVFAALNDLTPMNENDFNNFNSSIFDKFNRQGYLIYIDKYYIFQPFIQNETVPMDYRAEFNKKMRNQLSLYNYIKHVSKDSDSKFNKDEDEETEIAQQTGFYDFDSVMEYYDSRNENKYVGIINKESSRRKVKSADELSDVFKIREMRKKNISKKREIGLFTMLGSVCATSKEKELLVKIAKDIGLTFPDSATRFAICDSIRDRLLFLEKYSSSKKKNKVTYMIIPSNHPVYKFPYNLEDRKDHILNKIKEKIKFKLDIDVKEIPFKVQNETMTTYEITIVNTKDLGDFADYIKSLGFELEGKKWIVKID